MNKNEVEQLQKCLDKIDYPILFEVKDCIWYLSDDDYIYCNTDDNEEDLLNGEGNTYSWYLPESYKVEGDYIVFNGDTESGYWVTIVLPLSKQKKWS